MAKHYDCDKGTILKFAKDIGYTNKQKSKLSESDKKYILNAYDKETSTDLAEQFHVSRGMITKLWKDNNLKGKDTHKYPFNYSYFKSIDSIDKAYFLGLLASDGNVYTNNNHSCTVRLTLDYEDRYILQLFSRVVNSDKPLRVYTNIKKTGYVGKYVSLELVSEIMTSDLKKYGIVDNKTEKILMPKIDDWLTPHYLRGYFDGDGSVSISENKIFTPSSYSITISGFVNNLKTMQECLLENNIISNITIDKRKDDGLQFGTLYLPTIKEKYKFLNYIYKDCDIYYISRKKYKADIFIYSILQNFSNRRNIYNKIKMPS